MPSGGAVAIPKPSHVFDRDWEWDHLVRFVTDETPGATLGVVSGRRRQGKSYLLDSLAQDTRGLYVEATKEVESRALAQLGAQIGEFTRSPAPLSLPDWGSALDALLALGRQEPVMVVLDEFPYLLAGSPALASLVQRAFGPRRAERLESRTRLIVCGSALSVMSDLMSGQAPLRGRASLELPINTFDLRCARQFWDIEDLRTAFLVHAVLGGTPAYRDLIRRDIPRTTEEFEPWVCRTVLHSASPLHREARYLFAEDLEVREPLIYHSVLATVADGETTRGRIASGIGKKTTDIGQTLRVLEDTGFLVRDEDVFAARKPTWHLADPIMRFHYAVMRPVWQSLQRPERIPALWSRRRATFTSQILGPHFERVCREWVSRFAEPGTFGGTGIGQVGHGVLHAGRDASYEIDVAVFDAEHSRRLLSVGEVKWGEVMGLSHLARVREATAWIAARTSLDVTATVPACYSAAGFTDDLRAESDQGHVVLVDLDRIYHGT